MALMNLLHINCHHLLTLDLEDAFALQAALTEAIRQATKVTTDCALRGAKVTHYQTGQMVGPLTYEVDGHRPRPSALSIAVQVGEPK